MNACPATCRDMASESECEEPCNEGCQCNPGYLYSGDECVPYKDCGCTYLGIYYKIGDSLVTEDCSQKCTCTNSSSVVCDDMQCNEDEQCTTSNQIRGCYIPSPCLENPCENGGTCVEVTGSGNSTSGMRCECPSSHKGMYCEEENQSKLPMLAINTLGNNTIIYIVIGVVIGVFLISFVFIFAAYFYLKARRKKGHILESSNSSDDRRDNNSLNGSLYLNYEEPGSQLNMAFNNDVMDQGEHNLNVRTSEDIELQMTGDGTAGQDNPAFDGNLEDSDKPKAHVQFDLSEDSTVYINEKDEVTIF
ncbi:uncharacterized protein PAF06_007599 [Gastrophryne carolinensis]